MININIGEVPSATYLPLSGGTMTGTLTTVAVTIGGAVAGGDQAFTNVGDMTFATGSILASGSTNGNTLLIRANDTTFITLTTGATDACTLDAITMSGTWLASGTVTLPAFTLGGAVAGGDQAFTNVGDMTFAAGSIIASGSTNGNTLLIRANDTTFITLTTGATDACTLDAITMSGTWLASGTVTIPAVTLSGTIDLSANIFTNSFEMYRALLRETLYGSHFDATGGNSALTGTGSVSVGENGIYMATGTTHASSAGRRATPHTITAGGTQWASINWGKKFFVAFSLIWTGATGTNLIFRFHVTQATTVGALAAHGLGLQTNGTNINLVTYGANGSVATVSGATDLVLDKRVWVLIEHDPAVADRLYVNGVLVATQSTAGDIPSTEPSVAYYLHPSIARSGGADVGVEEARWYNIQFGQEA